MSVEVPKKWDHEADVIIVGGGTAGLPAAITVAEAGLKATILESRPQCGGSFNMVVGGFSIAGSDEQKEAGIEDSPELFYQDEINTCGADPEIARAFADNQLDAYRMLKGLGIKFPGVFGMPGMSIVRTLRCGGMGPVMVKALEKGAREKGVEILFRHRAMRLITDPQTGRVIGVNVDVKGETKNFKAKRTVILATGGFGRNREMVAEYAPEMADAVPLMPVGHLGDGLKMGLALGAATKDIGAAVAPSWPICAETHLTAPLNGAYEGGILVNVNGQRFYDESVWYGHYTAASMQQPSGLFWIVYDDKIRKAPPFLASMPTVDKAKEYKGDTIEELAKSTGIDVKGLKESINKYNSDIDSVGYDTVFGRRFQMGIAGPLVIKIDEPPFYAIKCTISTTSMKGGLKINGRSQVINQYGGTIPGLYAAGELAGGLHTKSYLLGVMSSSSMTQGIIAARNSVKEPAWQ